MNEGIDTCNAIIATIRKIIRAVDIHSKKLRVSAGITGPQLIILKEIKHQQHITTTELAKKISLSQSTVTSILDRLVERNLVTRIRDDIDKRKWFLEISNSGIGILDNAPTAMQKSFIDNFLNLPQLQQQHMLATLQQIANLMHEDVVKI